MTPYILALFFTIMLISLARLKHNKGILLVLGVVMIIIAGCRIPGLDYKNYLEQYDFSRDGLSLLIEPTFVLISKISPLPIVLFIIYAVLGVTLKTIAVKQLSKYVYLSLLIYCSHFYILHEMIQIRAGVAAGLLLLCIKPIFNRDLTKFLFFSGAAIMFHYSALFILPLWFISVKSRKTALALIIPLGYVFYFIGLSPINVLSLFPYFKAVQVKLTVYQNNAGEFEINVLNAIHLFKIVLFYILLVKYELLCRYNRFTPVLMKIFAISLVCIPLFAEIPALAFRISELYGVVEIILIPMILYLFKGIFTGRLIVILTALLLLLMDLFYNNLL